MKTNAGSLGQSLLVYFLCVQIQWSTRVLSMGDCAARVTFGRVCLISNKLTGSLVVLAIRYNRMGSVLRCVSLLDMY